MEFLDSLSGIQIEHTELHKSNRAYLEIKINGSIETVRNDKALIREILEKAALRAVWTDKTESEA